MNDHLSNIYNDLLNIKITLLFCRRRKLEEVAKHETLPPHPNCVTFYRAWEERQRLYIQAELCKIRYKSIGVTLI